MKKIICFCLIIAIFLLNNRTAAVVIPDTAIRIRVIASSDSEEDQAIKQKVRELLEYKMYNLLKNIKGVDVARKTIQDNLNDLNDEVDKLLKKEQYEEGFNMNYGMNYFPEKEYKGIKYEEGYYESLVVTLGEGKGENWWCVLFPPLCLIEAEESDEVEYKFFVKELIEKYF